VLAGAAQALLPADDRDPWAALHGFRANAAVDPRIAVEVAEVIHIVAASADPRAVATRIGRERVLFVDGEAWAFGAPVAGHVGGAALADGAILSPMPGRILSVDVAAGDTVAKGQRLIVLEAMKMEQAMLAPFDGIVTELGAVAGAQVREGMLLARIETQSS